MSIIEIIFIAVSLAMDAFAVSVCKGLAIKKLDYKKIITIALYFGVFQALMPVIGYLLGIKFQNVILNIDHWIAFILLSVIGINMILESLREESDKINDSVDFKTMIILAIATSIDALAVGITFAFLQVDLIMSTFIIGIITFLISFIGVKIGNRFGNRYENKAELAGGIILILIGLKILLEHLGILF